MSAATLLASPNAVGTISQSVDASQLRGRQVRLDAHLKLAAHELDGQGECWLGITRPNRRGSFFDDTLSRPIHSPTWARVSLTRKVDSDAERIEFGCVLAGVGHVWIDDVQLWSQNASGLWEAVSINNPGFENGDDRKRPAGWTAESPGYTFQVTDASHYSGRRSLEIASRFVVEGEFFPIGWSLDGRYVYAFGARSGTHFSEVTRILTDGSDSTSLTDLGLPPAVLFERFSFAGVTITPDGQRIVLSLRQSQSDVWIAENFDGGG